MVTGPEAAHAGKDAHLCAGLNSVIKELVHRVQYIWGTNSTEENRVFLIVDANKAFNEIN